MEREKKMSDIKQYHNVRELARDMYLSAMEGKYVSSVLFYDEAINLLRCLICDYNLIPNSLEITPYEYGYEKEYIVSIVDSGFGDFSEIIVEKAIVNGEYVSIDSDIIYAYGDASSKAIVNSPIECVIVFELNELDSEFDPDYNDDSEDIDVFDALVETAIDNAEIVKDIYGEIIKVNIDIYDILMYLHDDESV